MGFPKKTNKEIIFERMAKLDPSFKPRLNEHIWTGEPHKNDVKKDYGKYGKKLPLYYSMDINGIDIKKFEEYINHQLSSDNSDEEVDENHIQRETWVFDFPKSVFDENWLHTLKGEEGRINSHGVEGNAGGYVTRGYKEVEELPDVYRYTINVESLLDI